MPFGAALGPRSTPLPFPAWTADDHAAALAAYAQTHALIAGTGWPAPPGLSADARAFFEAAFRAPPPDDGPPGLLTGYFEPELDGSRESTPRFRVPLHGLPPGGVAGVSRAAVAAGALAGHEIAWVVDPLEAFLLQVQGSGRIRLAGGGMLRLGFAGKNGLPYASIGRALVERGAVAADAISLDAIRAWARAHPGDLPALLALNASYVVFRDLSDLPPGKGPLGAMGRPLTPMRSLAVDPRHIPLGAPVWIEAEGLACLAVAQDTGSAIQGPQRGDLFLGTGAEAGARAGRLRAPCRLVALRPAGSRS